jgi:hypothetical protein
MINFLPDVKHRIFNALFQMLFTFALMMSFSVLAVRSVGIKSKFGFLPRTLKTQTFIGFLLLLNWWISRTVRFLLFTVFAGRSSQSVGLSRFKKRKDDIGAVSIRGN